MRLGVRVCRRHNHCEIINDNQHAHTHTTRARAYSLLRTQTYNKHTYYVPAFGGWTRQYTSPRPVFSAASMPSLTGKTAIVTGANTGIGLESVRELGRAGAHVFMACRSTTKCAAAEQNLRASGLNDTKLTLMKLDLSSLKSIESFSADFLSRDLPLNILMLNAGIMKIPDASQKIRDFEKTEDGLEIHIGTNHVGHFYLTQLLTERLRASAPSRVVVISSIAELLSYPEGFRFDLWKTNNMPASQKNIPGPKTMLYFLACFFMMADDDDGPAAMTLYGMRWLRLVGSLRL